MDDLWPCNTFTVILFVQPVVVCSKILKFCFRGFKQSDNKFCSDSYAFTGARPINGIAFS